MSRGGERGELRATLLLRVLPGIGDVTLGSVVARFGSAEAALGAPERAFADAAGPAATEARGDAALADRIDRALAWCDERGVRIVRRGGPGYPKRLAEIPNPPGALFLAGEAALMDAEIVTVVGSRHATEYGRRVARDVTAVAVRRGAVVASGLAIGIDGEAHRTTLELGGRTIAVLGSGFAHTYPRVHARLARTIAREGLLVSEFLPDEPPFAGNFVRRNRTLAALAKVVVLVEADHTGGALRTAEAAVELAREILTVPGPIYSSKSRGTNALLQSTTPLLQPEDVALYLGERRAQPLALWPEGPSRDLGADALRLWEALAETPGHVDELARSARMSPARALCALSLLEMEGWVRQEPGTRFARAAGAA